VPDGGRKKSRTSRAQSKQAGNIRVPGHGSLPLSTRPAPQLSSNTPNFWMYRSRLARLATASARQSRSLTSVASARPAPCLLRQVGASSFRSSAPLSLARANVSRAGYSTEASEEVVKAGPPEPLAPLFECTPKDKARLTRMRNVGISAHIDVSYWVIVNHSGDVLTGS